MANSLAVINCSQVVTLAGAKRARTRGDLRQLAIIEDGGLLIRDSRIEAVGRRREIEALIDADCEVIDAGKRVLLPGFVDAHAHPVFAGNRANEFEQRTAGATYREIAARGGGIRANCENSSTSDFSDSTSPAIVCVHSSTSARVGRGAEEKCRLSRSADN